MSDDEIFAAAYREHYWAVSRYVARRLDGRTNDVEEVVAEVFTVAWRRRAELPPVPLPWLYGVARNCLANAVRGYGRRRRLVDRLAGHESAQGRQTVDSPDAEAPGAWVHDALARLGPADQEVLRLTAWEELGIDEVAVVLGCGSRAAAMRLHRARRRLRAEIARLPSADRPRDPGTPGREPSRDAGTPDQDPPRPAGSPGPDSPRHNGNPGSDASARAEVPGYEPVRLPVVPGSGQARHAGPPTAPSPRAAEPCGVRAARHDCTEERGHG